MVVRLDLFLWWNRLILLNMVLEKCGILHGDSPFWLNVGGFIFQPGTLRCRPERGSPYHYPEQSEGSGQMIRGARPHFVQDDNGAASGGE